MTKEQQTAQSRAAIEGFATVAAHLGPFANPTIRHVYAVTPGDRPVSCGDGVELKVRPGPPQAYAEIAVETLNNKWEFTVWLEQDGDGWRVSDVHLDPAEIIGLTASDLLAMARRERDGGRVFNAALLFQAAGFVAQRGPDMMLAVTPAIEQDLQSLVAPPELRGPLPFTWTLAGKTYKVAQVSIMGVAKELGVVFVLPQDSWDGEAAADARNREFLDAFRAAHPDYATAFGFLLARAMKPDNSGGFGTVYDNASGYGKNAP